MKSKGNLFILGVKKDEIQGEPFHFGCEKRRNSKGAFGNSKGPFSFTFQKASKPNGNPIKNGAFFAVSRPQNNNVFFSKLSSFKLCVSF